MRLQKSVQGTMSLNEIAVDLTCEDEEFEPATTTTSEEDEHPVPGHFLANSSKLRVNFPSGPSSSTTAPQSPHHAHSGMLRMARAMGGIGKPVQLAVHEALLHNPDYGMAMFVSSSISSLNLLQSSFCADTVLVLVSLGSLVS
jgi:hypothetical protein